MVSIEDVTDRAARLRDVLGKNPDDDTLHEKVRKPDLSIEELIELDVMPRETEYVVDDILRSHLKMDGNSDS